MGFGVWGLGFSLGLRVSGFRFRVSGIRESKRQESLQAAQHSEPRLPLKPQLASLDLKLRPIPV